MNGQAGLSWSAPTTRSDGSTLPANQIQGFNVYRATAPAGPFAKIASVPAAQLGYADSNLDAATYYYNVTCVDTAGTEGAPTTTLSKVILPAPNPPTGFAVV